MSMSVSNTLAADYRCISGGGHGGPQSAKTVQEVQKDETETEGSQEAVGISVEHPTPCCHCHSSGVCGGGHHMDTAVGLHM